MARQFTILKGDLANREEYRKGGRKCGGRLFSRAYDARRR